MKQMMDIALDANDDLKVVNGDWAVAESTNAHQRALLFENKGDRKQDATIGVGLVTFLDDEGNSNIVREIAMQFIQDGMSVDNMKPNPASLTDSTVKIFPNAYYK